MERRDGTMVKKKKKKEKKNARARARYFYATKKEGTSGKHFDFPCIKMYKKSRTTRNQLGKVACWVVRTQTHRHVATVGQGGSQRNLDHE